MTDGTNELAALIAKQLAADEGSKAALDSALAAGKNPMAALLGRKGGLKGGKARAAKLSPERRREIAQTAARARWKKARGEADEP